MNIETLKERLRLPVIAAPMFLVSGPEMVLECCRHNIVGAFPSVNRRTTDEFEGWVKTVKAGLLAHDAHSTKPAAPFAVNLVIHKTNPRWRADLEVCIRHKVPLIITSLGTASEVVEAVHAYGGLVFHDVAHAYHAGKAAAAGVDGIIAIANGAGGHSGSINPLALIAEIRAFWDGTLILGGAISTGRDIAAALQMGADLAYMGTRFINVKESMASTAYKNMILEADSSQILFTPSVTGVGANFLKPSLIAAGYDLAALSDPAAVNYGEKLKPPKEDSKTWVDTWSAGHGVGAIRDVPTVGELVDRLALEFVGAIRDQDAKTARYSPQNLDL